MNPSARAGADLRCTDDLTNELAVASWAVQTGFRTHEWSKWVTVDWIVHMIFEQRAFTNLRQIPAAVNDQAIDTLKRTLGREGLPHLSDQLELRFQITPIVALSQVKKTFNDHVLERGGVEQAR